MPKIAQNIGKMHRNGQSMLKVAPRSDRARRDGSMPRGQETTISPAKKDIRA